MLTDIERNYIITKAYKEAGINVKGLVNAHDTAIAARGSMRAYGKLSQSLDARMAQPHLARGSNPKTQSMVNAKIEAGQDLYDSKQRAYRAANSAGLPHGANRNF